MPAHFNANMYLFLRLMHSNPEILYFCIGFCQGIYWLLPHDKLMLLMGILLAPHELMSITCDMWYIKLIRLWGAVVMKSSLESLFFFPPGLKSPIVGIFSRNKTTTNTNCLWIFSHRLILKWADIRRKQITKIYEKYTR